MKGGAVASARRRRRVRGCRRRPRRRPAMSLRARGDAASRQRLRFRTRARGVVVAPGPSKALAPVRARPGASSPSETSGMLSVVKTEARRLARELRQSEGRSIKEIAKELGVSRSSVSRWVRDIELNDQQLAALLERNPAYNRQLNGWLVVASRRRAARVRAQQRGRALARRREPLHVAGCMLYWAEGSKMRNSLQFSNSDPEMVRFFVRFLRAYFDLEDEQIRITCYLSPTTISSSTRSRAIGST